MNSINDQSSYEAHVTQFLKQKEEFTRQALGKLGLEDLNQFQSITTRDPIPLQPTLINDFRSLTKEEISQMISDYFGEHGVASFIVLNPDDHPTHGHPLHDIAVQLSENLSLTYPLEHPMEKHPEAIKRFGLPDGTLKIYDLSIRDGKTGYREQAETPEMFHPHNDGLGYGGTVQSFILYMDSAPLWGGYTFFQNIIQLSLSLAKVDEDAFYQLFRPDALTVIRPRGKGAIKVVTPILFLNESGQPQVFFRVSTGEYKVMWRSEPSALNRAEHFLNTYTQPFAPGSTFVHFTSRGHGCIVRNPVVVHGRTPFVDGKRPEQRRVLARKWFMSEARHAIYKHVPGIYIYKKYANLFPQWFGEQVLEGEWLYDAKSDQNVRVK